MHIGLLGLEEGPTQGLSIAIIFLHGIVEVGLVLVLSANGYPEYRGMYTVPDGQGGLRITFLLLMTIKLCGLFLFHYFLNIDASQHLGNFYGPRNTEMHL